MNEINKIQEVLFEKLAGLRLSLGFILLVITLAFQNSIQAEQLVINSTQTHHQKYLVNAHTDSLTYPNVGINVQKTVDQTEVCSGDSVIYTLTVRILGGSDGIDIRNIRITDSQLSNPLTTASTEFLEYSDINGNDILDFIDNDHDGKSDEEFVWMYSKTIIEDNVNIARDTGDVFFNSNFIGQVSNRDEVTVTVNDSICFCENPNVVLDGGDITCDVNQVQILLTTNGNSYSWRGPDDFESNELNPIVSVPGVYTVTVSLGDCYTTRSIPIGVNFNEPVVALSGGTLSCSNPSVNLNPSSNGSIVSLTGPDPLTSPGNPFATLPGIYTLMAEGTNGCSNSTTALVLSDTTNLKVSGQVVDTDCGIADGRITITTSGGQAPYTFNWSSGESIQNIDSLPAGRYMVSVTDVNGCTGIASFIVQSIDDNLVVNIDKNQNPNCSTGATGSITAEASNGIPPYSYNWSTGDTTTTISNLGPGSYFVDVYDAIGCFVTERITITEEEDCDAMIGDLVFNDLNQNGIQNSGESGIDSVLVRLFDPTGRLINEILSDSLGNYNFEGLPGGQYIVEFEWPFGYGITLSNQGIDDEADSDINTRTQRTDVFTLENHETNFSIDAGFFKTTAIGDFVWNDENEDGIQDINEPGIEGVRVELYSENDILIDSTFTDGNGNYIFINVNPGIYYVRFVLPEFFRFSSSVQGNDVLLDSDADQSTGQTALFMILEKEDITIDAGVKRIDCDQLFMIPEDSLVTFCSMDNVNLAVTTNFGDSISWFDQDKNDIGQGLMINIDPSEVTVATAIGFDIFGCSDTSIFRIEPFSFDINIEAPKAICEDEEFSISVQTTSNENFTYEWVAPTGVTISDFLSPQPTFSGNYDDPLMLLLSVTKDDEPECFLDTTISIQVIHVDITIDEGVDNCILLGESVTLTAQTNVDNPLFDWAPVTSTENQITDNPEEETIYEVQVTHTTINKTCSAVNTISVFPCIWDVPDAFSPNGNINNDEFRVRTAKNTELSPFNMKILNRWGEEIFISTSITDGWNGQYKNRNLPSDVYAYCIQVTCPDGTVDIRSGNVTLIR